MWNTRGCLWALTSAFCNTPCTEDALAEIASEEAETVTILVGPMPRLCVLGADYGLRSGELRGAFGALPLSETDASVLDVLVPDAPARRTRPPRECEVNLFDSEPQEQSGNLAGTMTPGSSLRCVLGHTRYFC